LPSTVIASASASASALPGGAHQGPLDCSTRAAARRSIFFFHLPVSLLFCLLISIDTNFCGHLQKLAGIHSSEPLQFLRFLLYVPWAWLTKAALIICWFSVASRSKGCTNGKLHTNAHRTAWDSCLAFGGPLMFFSWPFSLLPSCLPIMLPDLIQGIGSLGHH
jgi:hypothetical protein